MNKWISWCVCYARRGVGSWTLNHRTTDGKKTLCGKRIPLDAFDVYHDKHPSSKDCKRCQDFDAKPVTVQP